jgi:hypothetical protein
MMKKLEGKDKRTERVKSAWENVPEAEKAQKGEEYRRQM